MAEMLIAGRYRLDELLGRGGMSEVWCATDTELGRRVALKLLAPNADTARFEREARAVAQLSHPHITQLYDYGEADGRPYMVLEYLPGGTLEDRLRAGTPLPDDDTRRISAELASGLAHAHARNVVHRDLKPANVLFDEEGRAKLADFGIARMAAGEGTFTEAGTVLGTAAYISPEQAAGEPATTASDVYSFGVLLYRMLTGRLPFVSDDPLQLVQLHRDAVPPPVSEFRADAPPLIESATNAALAKDPADRPQDGTALLAALGAPLGATLAAASVAQADTEATRVLPVTTVPPAEPAGPPPGPPPPRRTLLPLTVGGLAVLALAGAGLAYELTRPASGSTPPASTPAFTLPKTAATTGTTTSTSTSTPSTTTATTKAATTRHATTTAPATTPLPTTSPPATAPPTTTVPPPPTTTTTTPPTTDTTPTTGTTTTTPTAAAVTTTGP